MSGSNSLGCELPGSRLQPILYLKWVFKCDKFKINTSSLRTETSYRPGSTKNVHELFHMCMHIPLQVLHGANAINFTTLINKGGRER